jgi:Mor family transcriptional regulator
MDHTETRIHLLSKSNAFFGSSRTRSIKFYERTLKDTKHIIDRETGKFQGQNARASKFTDAERATICKRRIDGETYARIGKTYCKGVSTIKNICQNWGPKNNYPFETKIGKSDLKKVTSSEIKTAICKEYSEGVSALKLATKYELSFQTVYTFLADWGPKNNIPYIKNKTD